MLHPRTPGILWQRKQQTLTLSGQPVLEYQLYFPELIQSGLAGRCISAYYRRMAHVWERRWRQEVYLRACLDFSQRQAAGKPFTPWQGSLHGELTLFEAPLLSIHFSGLEKQGASNPSRVSWGDVWNIKTGAPCHWSDFLDPPHTKAHLTNQILAQGTQLSSAGTRFFRSDWERQITPHLPIKEFWLTQEQLHLSFPQCSISPAVEGTPEFVFPRK